MDWIERTLHVSPDGGNGMLEAAIYIALLIAIVLTVSYLRRARSSKHPRA
jgi:hypothetical protein